MNRGFEQEQAALFAEWREHLAQGNLPFYEDGLARDSSYWETQPRVLFLLKEVNANQYVDAWNLFDVVGDGSIRDTWTVISYWTHGIHGGGLPWRDVPDATPDNLRKALSKIAVVNVNKCGGGATSIGAELWVAAYRDREFLRRQIRLYAPDIIIAGGTGDIARHLLFEEHWQDWNRHSDTVYWIRPSALETVLVSTYHPQARIEHRKLYEDVLTGLKAAGTLPAKVQG